MKLTKYKGIYSNGTIVKIVYPKSNKKYSKKHKIQHDTTYCIMCNSHTCKSANEKPEKPRSSKSLKKNKFYHKYSSKWCRKQLYE